ncbi:MAG: DUF4041 domain-containing protein, partial [Chloroflexi bacterium]|nr:DUF4041 domain-containing protein [Chloroflexota bacterium]
MSDVSSVPQTHDLIPPLPRKHGRFSARKSMEAEIEDLRDFIAEVLPTAIPQRYAELDRQIEQLEEMREQLRKEHEQEERELAEVRQEHAKLRVEVVELREEAILQEVGVYDYRHPMENASDYKEALTELRRQIKGLARDGDAVSTTDSNWTVNDSKAKGRKMIRDTSKLLLRAYNNEADTLVDKLRPFKLEAAISRLEKSRAAINRLGAQPMEIAITTRYHRLRTRELELAADWLARKEEEKEEAKAERARLREEAKAQKEIEEARKNLLKERAHYAALVQKLREEGNESEAAEQEQALEKIDIDLADVEVRAAKTGAGHVYVISNVGTLGEEMVKIGMTRRLDPLDRVKELGDASVPFGYDIHALVFSDDAVSLERDLHRQFESRRVNLVNLRREFFYVSPGEVRDALEQHESAVLTEFVE